MRRVQLVPAHPALRWFTLLLAVVFAGAGITSGGFSAVYGFLGGICFTFWLVAPDSKAKPAR